MELKATRRIVTGHDAQGKAVVLFDAALPAKQRNAGGNGMTLLWVTGESPVDVGGAADRAQTQVGVPPPANGTVFRIVDFAPLPPNAAFSRLRRWSAAFPPSREPSSGTVSRTSTWSSS